MPRGIAKSGKRIVPKGLKRKSRAYIPGRSSFVKAHIDNHYKERGLSLEDFTRISQMDCYYCGAKPRRVNPYGSTYDVANKRFRISEQYYQDCYIYMNGVDKVIPQHDYTDLSNLVPCCTICNWFKGTYSKQEFLTHINQIYQYQHQEELT